MRRSLGAGTLHEPRAPQGAEVLLAPLRPELQLSGHVQCPALRLAGHHLLPSKSTEKKLKKSENRRFETFSRRFRLLWEGFRAFPMGFLDCFSMAFPTFHGRFKDFEG